MFSHEPEPFTRRQGDCLELITIIEERGRGRNAPTTATHSAENERQLRDSAGVWSNKFRENIRAVISQGLKKREHFFRCRVYEHPQAGEGVADTAADLEFAIESITGLVCGEGRLGPPKHLKRSAQGQPGEGEACCRKAYERKPATEKTADWSGECTGQHFDGTACHEVLTVSKFSEQYRVYLLESERCKRERDVFQMPSPLHTRPCLADGGVECLECICLDRALAYLCTNAAAKRLFYADHPRAPAVHVLCLSVL